MSDFGKMTTAKGFFAPQRFEADVLDCEVLGHNSERAERSVRARRRRLGLSAQRTWTTRSSTRTAMSAASGFMTKGRLRKGRWIKTPAVPGQRQGRAAASMAITATPMTVSLGTRNIDKPYLNTVAEHLGRGPCRQTLRPEGGRPPLRDRSQNAGDGSARGISTAAIRARPSRRIRRSTRSAAKC